MKIGFVWFVFLLSVAPGDASAWGKRGHALVTETAARLLAETENGAGFLRAHSFDLGYYANVPDLIWRRPASEKHEFPQHFMDLEVFKRGLKGAKGGDPYALARGEFDAKYPRVPVSAGRSFWRIRELARDLNGVTASLKKGGAEKRARQRLQEKWLTLAGVLSHYVGDLAQPLHTTENYDGQMTGQKGIHRYFETAAVDALPARLEEEVASEAARLWPGYRGARANDDVLTLVRALAESSYGKIGDVLAADRESGRADLQRDAERYHDLIVERLALGSVTLAELWRRELGWQFDGDRFYLFDESPAYVVPR